MIKLDTIIVIILVIILISYLSFMSYLMMKIISDNKVVNKIEENVNATSSFQTEFFNKSVEYAQKVLFNKVFIQEYGESTYYGNKLIDTLSKLNDETKQSIMIAIKYMSIEPSMARTNENVLRSISEQERVPLWFIILRESTNKVVPSVEVKDNIVPLFKTA